MADSEDDSSDSSERDHRDPTRSINVSLSLSRDPAESGHQEFEELASEEQPGSSDDDTFLEEAEKTHNEIRAAIQKEHDQIQRDVKNKGIKELRSCKIL